MNKQFGKSTVATIIIIMLVIILLAVTNPNHDAHIEAIKDAYWKKDPVTSAVGLGMLVINPPKYNNMTLLSYTKYKNKLSTVGIFGYVWVDDKVFR